MLHRFYCAHIPLLGFCLSLSSFSAMFSERRAHECLYTRILLIRMCFYFFKFHYEIFIAATLLLSLFSSTVFGVIFLCWFIWFILPSIHSFARNCANQNFYANRRSVRFLIYRFILLFIHGIFAHLTRAILSFSLFSFKLEEKLDRLVLTTFFHWWGGSPGCSNEIHRLQHSHSISLLNFFPPTIKNSFD